MAREAVRRLVKKSTKAVCGIMERELTVPKTQKAEAIRKLRNAGFRIIGTSHGDIRTSKIWFIVRGGF